MMAFQNCGALNLEGFHSAGFQNEVSLDLVPEQDDLEESPVGDPRQPSKSQISSIEQLNLTTTNRNYPGVMFGGWGPHLRGFFTNTKNELWFVHDSDSSLETTTNPNLDYRRFDGQKWSLVGQQEIENLSIIQNLAHIIVGDTILSYGVGAKSRPNRVYECYFSTLNYKKACNAMFDINNKIIESENGWNYHGAVVSHDGQTRVIYWTSGGLNGGPGEFIYAYKTSSPYWAVVRSPIGDHNALAYVNAKVIDDKFYGVGQTWKGAYPEGRPYVVAMEFNLGENLDMSELSSFSGEPARFSSDILIDPTSKLVHIMSITDQGNEYYFKPGHKNWSEHTEPLNLFKGVYRARFTEINSQTYTLITGSGVSNKIDLYFLDSNISESFKFLNKTEIEIADKRFSGVHAIYTNSLQYQKATGVEKDLEIGVVGIYQESDHIIQHIKVKFNSL